MNIDLRNNDCYEQLKKLPDNSVDIILTDLPYGTLNKTKKNENKTDTVYKIDWDGQLNYDLIIPEMLRVIKPNRAIILFAQAPFTFSLYQNMTKHGALWRNNWIWDKCNAANFASAKLMPLKNFEQIMIFYKQDKSKKRTVAYYPQGVTDLQPVLVKCRFYLKSTGEPIEQDKVWDEVIIPYLFINLFKIPEGLNILKDISCITTPDSSNKKNVSNTRYSLNKLLEDINLLSINKSTETSSFRRSGLSIKNLLENTGVIPDRGGRKKPTSSEEHSNSLDKILKDIIYISSSHRISKETSSLTGSGTKLENLLKNTGVIADRSGRKALTSSESSGYNLENLLEDINYISNTHGMSKESSSVTNGNALKKILSQVQVSSKGNLHGDSDLNKLLGDIAILCDNGRNY